MAGRATFVVPALAVMFILGQPTSTAAPALPETIRVQLTVAPGALRLVPPPAATVQVDSQPLPAEPSTMTVGWALRFLRLPAVDATPMVEALVTRTPGACALAATSSAGERTPKARPHLRPAPSFP